MVCETLTLDGYHAEQTTKEEYEENTDDLGGNDL